MKSTGMNAKDLSIIFFKSSVYLPKLVKAFLVTPIERQPLDCIKSASQPAILIINQNAMYGSAEYRPF